MLKRFFFLEKWLIVFNFNYLFYYRREINDKIFKVVVGIYSVFNVFLSEEVGECRREILLFVEKFIFWKSLV